MSGKKRKSGVGGKEKSLKKARVEYKNIVEHAKRTERNLPRWLS